MTVTKKLSLPTLTVGETGQAVLDHIEATLSIVSDTIQNVVLRESGLPEGTPKGRVVSIGAGGILLPMVYLAFANPPVGQETRRNAFGITLDTAPASGQNIRVLTLGVVGFDHSNSVGSRTNPDIGGAGTPVPVLAPSYGLVAYLSDGDISDPNTQGFATSDESASTNSTVLGVFLPNSNMLLQPRLLAL